MPAIQWYTALGPEDSDRRSRGDLTSIPSAPGPGGPSSFPRPVLGLQRGFRGGGAGRGERRRGLGAALQEPAGPAAAAAGAGLHGQRRPVGQARQALPGSAPLRIRVRRGRECAAPPCVRPGRVESSAAAAVLVNFLSPDSSWMCVRRGGQCEKQRKRSTRGVKAHRPETDDFTHRPEGDQADHHRWAERPSLSRF